MPVRETNSTSSRLFAQENGGQRMSVVFGLGNLKLRQYVASTWTDLATVAGGASANDTWYEDLQRSYVQRPGWAIGATLAEVPGDDIATDDYRYFIRDLHGSTRGAYDEAKNGIGSMEYRAFGEVQYALGAESALGFTGQRQGGFAADYNFSLRHYDPAINRWMGRDPLGPVAGINMHNYVNGNPVAFVDPKGGNPALILIPIGLGAAAGVLAAFCGTSGQSPIARAGATFVGAFAGGLTAAIGVAAAAESWAVALGVGLASGGVMSLALDTLPGDSPLERMSQGIPNIITTLAEAPPWVGEGVGLVNAAMNNRLP